VHHTYAINGRTSSASMPGRATLPALAARDDLGLRAADERVRRVVQAELAQRLLYDQRPCARVQARGQAQARGGRERLARSQVREQVIVLADKAEDVRTAARAGDAGRRA
jgi:hypothetical protein